MVYVIFIVLSVLDVCIYFVICSVCVCVGEGVNKKISESYKSCWFCGNEVSKYILIYLLLWFVWDKCVVLKGVGVIYIGKLLKIIFFFYFLKIIFGFVYVIFISVS